MASVATLFFIVFLIAHSVIGLAMTRAAWNLAMNNSKVRMGPEPEETKIHEPIRLRNEAAAAEQQGKHLLNVALLFKDGKQYDDAIEKWEVAAREGGRASRAGGSGSV